MTLNLSISGIASIVGAYDGGDAERRAAIRAETFANLQKRNSPSSLPSSIAKIVAGYEGSSQATALISNAFEAAVEAAEGCFSSIANFQHYFSTAERLTVYPEQGFTVRNCYCLYKDVRATLISAGPNPEISVSLPAHILSKMLIPFGKWLGVEKLQDTFRFKFHHDLTLNSTRAFDLVTQTRKNVQASVTDLFQIMAATSLSQLTFSPVPLLLVSLTDWETAVLNVDAIFNRVCPSRVPPGYDCGMEMEPEVEVSRIGLDKAKPDEPFGILIDNPQGFTLCLEDAYTFSTVSAFFNRLKLYGEIKVPADTTLAIFDDKKFQLWEGQFEEQGQLYHNFGYFLMDKLVQPSGKGLHCEGRAQAEPIYHSFQVEGEEEERRIIIGMSFTSEEAFTLKLVNRPHLPIQLEELGRRLIDERLFEVSAPSLLIAPPFAAAEIQALADAKGLEQLASAYDQIIRARDPGKAFRWSISDEVKRNLFVVQESAAGVLLTHPEEVSLELIPAPMTRLFAVLINESDHVLEALKEGDEEAMRAVIFKVLLFVSCGLVSEIFGTKEEILSLFKSEEMIMETINHPDFQNAVDAVSSEEVEEVNEGDEGEVEEKPSELDRVLYAPAADFPPTLENHSQPMQHLISRLMEFTHRELQGKSEIKQVISDYLTYSEKESPLHGNFNITPNP